MRICVLGDKRLVEHIAHRPVDGDVARHAATCAPGEGQTCHTLRVCGAVSRGATYSHDYGRVGYYLAIGVGDANSHKCLRVTRSLVCVNYNCVGAPDRRRGVSRVWSGCGGCGIRASGRDRAS